MDCVICEHKYIRSNIANVSIRLLNRIFKSFFWKMAIRAILPIKPKTTVIHCTPMSQGLRQTWTGYCTIFSAWSFSFRNFISGVYEWVNIFSRIVCYVLRLFLKCAVQKRRVFFTKQCVPFPVCTFWIFLQRYCAMCRCAIMCAYWSDNGHIWLSGPNLGILDPKLPSQTLYLGWHLNG